MGSVKLLVALILALLCIILVVQNTETVETKILFATVSMPRALLLVLTTLVGFVVGILVAWGWSRKKTTEP